jgi:uncharacterized protein (DUF342 family)
MLVKGKILVEEVTVIPGDVNMEIGNINTLGAVILRVM